MFYLFPKFGKTLNNSNMEDLNIIDLRKKKKHIGIRVSNEERAALDEYCTREQISISDFFRIAIRKVINAKQTN